MKKRQILTLLLCAALLVGTVGATFSPQAKPEQDTNITWGTVESIDGSTLHVKNSSDLPLNDVIIHMAENAPIIDAVSGAAVELSSIKVGQAVYVTVAPVMTMSLPPQTTGLALITNIPADYKVPQYAVIDRLIATDDKTVLAEFVTADGRLQAKVSAETTLLRYVKPGEPAILSLPTVGELKPGCGVFVWYGASTKSIPAQTTLTQCVIVPSQHDGYVTVTETGVSLDGKAITLTDAQKPSQNQDGDILLPLRPVAEAAGWTLTWSGKDQPIRLTKADATVTLNLGSDQVVLQKDGSANYLRQSTQITNGVTFVDSTLFTLLNLYITIG